MIIGLPKEITPGETRVALTPEVARKLIQRGFSIIAEKSCGVKSGFPDSAYPVDGIQWTDAKSVFAADIILKINRPTHEEIQLFKNGAVLITHIEPFKKDGTFSSSVAVQITFVSPN